MWILYIYIYIWYPVCIDIKSPNAKVLKLQKLDPDLRRGFFPVKPQAPQTETLDLQVQCVGSVRAWGSKRGCWVDICQLSKIWLEKILQQLIWRIYERIYTKNYMNILAPFFLTQNQTMYYIAKLGTRFLACFGRCFMATHLFLQCHSNPLWHGCPMKCGRGIKKNKWHQTN